MNTDRSRWNDKYDSRGEELGSPEPCLTRQPEMLEPGSVLDVACGDGRNALYLAEQGWEVTGVDISERGLARLERFADGADLQIETVRRDLESPGALEGLDRYDNAVVIRFKPPNFLFDELADHLREGAKLLVCTFGLADDDLQAVPDRYCLAPDEYREISGALECLEHETFVEEGAYMESYLFEVSDSTASPGQ